MGCNSFKQDRIGDLFGYGFFWLFIGQSSQMAMPNQLSAQLLFGVNGFWQWSYVWSTLSLPFSLRVLTRTSV